MSSSEAAEVVDVDNAVGDVSPVDALVSEEVIECADDTTMEPQESENGRQSKAGRGSAVYDLEYASSDIFNLHDKLTQLKELAGQKYGGLHVIFTGDFSQLEPVNGTPLYHEPNFAPWHDWINLCRAYWPTPF